MHEFRRCIMNNLTCKWVHFTTHLFVMCRRILAHDFTYGRSANYFRKRLVCSTREFLVNCLLGKVRALSQVFQYQLMNESCALQSPSVFLLSCRTLYVPGNIIHALVHYTSSKISWFMKRYSLKNNINHAVVICNHCCSDCQISSRVMRTLRSVKFWVVISCCFIGFL